jgi:hypothetical protein
MILTVQVYRLQSRRKETGHKCITDQDIFAYEEPGVFLPNFLAFRMFGVAERYRYLLFKIKDKR